MSKVLNIETNDTAIVENFLNATNIARVSESEKRVLIGAFMTAIGYDGEDFAEAAVLTPADTTKPQAKFNSVLCTIFPALPSCR